MSINEHIVFVCSSLNTYGGLEKMTVETANLISSKGHKVTILILDNTIDTKYAINKNINVQSKPLNFGITTSGNVFSRKFIFLNHIRLLRKALKIINPTVVIGTEYVYSIAAKIVLKDKCRIFAWEHSHFYASKKNKFWSVLTNKIYKKLSGIICLNANERVLWEMYNQNVVTIPNFISLNNVVPSVEKTKTILTICQLKKVKGISYLLKTSLKILNKYPDWSWKLIGEGELNEVAKTFINDNGLTNRLIIEKPNNQDIAHEYKRSSLFVLTSQNECFPLVLIESLANALPCVSFDCDTGPRHIITHEQDGFLVPPNNIEKLVAAISVMIESEEMRKQMSERAFINSKKFHQETIYPLWAKLLLNK